MRGYPKLWQLPKTVKGLGVALKAPPDAVKFSWADYGTPDIAGESVQAKSLRSTAWNDKYGKAKNNQALKH